MACEVRREADGRLPRAQWQTTPAANARRAPPSLRTRLMMRLRASAAIFFFIFFGVAECVAATRSEMQDPHQRTVAGSTHLHVIGHHGCCVASSLPLDLMSSSSSSSSSMYEEAGAATHTHSSMQKQKKKQTVSPTQCRKQQ